MALQRDFCGGTHRVARRVERFFDERTRRMLKVKGVCRVSAEDATLARAPRRDGDRRPAVPRRLVVVGEALKETR
jgi:hypothetical protein